ncbi:MAG: R3H domain-containing nucleic acid-binding protein [Patescibacteria group bacterium]
MSQLQEKIKKLIELFSFADFSVNYDEGNSRFSIFINDDSISENMLQSIVSNLDHVIKLIAKKNNVEAVVVDVNNYRKKREDLIVELGRAAARKAMAEKTKVALPPMNAYERRLVHVELSSRPDIKTESAGEGGERHIIIMPAS